MQSSNKAAVEMRENCKTIFEEYYRSKKKHNNSNSNSNSNGNSNRATNNHHSYEHYTSGTPVAVPVRKTHNHHNYEHYTTGTPVAVPVRKTHNHHNDEHYTSGTPVAVPVRKKSKRNRNKKNTKQKQQHLKQQDNKKNLDHDRCHQIVEDDTYTVSDVSCSNSTLTTYDDTESSSVTILCAPFIETTTFKNTNESISENHSSQNSRVSREVNSNNDDNKRVVRFDMNVNERYEIESHMNFSNKERRNYWYNECEQDETREKLERLIVKYEKQVAKATKLSSSKEKTLQQDSCSSYYFRGFECWTTTESLKREYTIKQYRNSVMEEQNKQWNDNVIEYEYDNDCDYYDLLQKEHQMIAEFSMKATTDSARKAHLNGLEVAQEVQRLIGEAWRSRKVQFVPDGGRRETD